MHQPLLLLAPSKTMDFETPSPFPITPQTPLFIDEAARLVHALQKLSPGQLAKRMAISKPIAQTVHDYYAAWRSAEPGKTALWTYTGDVYKGVRAQQLTQADAEWAQQHVLIASGLYGVVRPFDGIQAYRLEMKATLKVGRPNNLYEFWGDKLAQYVSEQGADWFCNLSSDEYAKPIIKNLKMPIVTPVFFDVKPNGVTGTVPIYSKMMRGVMARWMIDHRVTTPEQLQQFTGHGYSYDAQRSQPNAPAFYREVMTPLRFE